MRPLIAFPALGLLVALCGCTHGFNRDALRERFNDGSVQSTDADVAQARDLRPQLRFPCRIAVYLKPSNSSLWRWTPEDRAALDRCAEALKKDGVASEVVILPEVLTGKGEPKDLRLAAAKVGADALFVVHGAAETDSSKNFAAVFDLTVVGGFIIPGSRRDALFLMEGVLLDVDNGYVYTGVQAEGAAKILRPTFVIEDKDAVRPAKAQAVGRFADEAVKQLRVLASRPCLPCEQTVQPAGGIIQTTNAVLPAVAPVPKPAMK
ncbi:MAG: hypothetical protein K2V38_20825 [Gemmataceae bacterium]|nr:hypothetical protein [Gemmataceae bacterium]